MWGPQVEALSAGFRLLVPDLPGYGGSPGPFTFDGAVGAVRELIGSRRAHVCGLSAGAMIGLRLAARHPDAVLSLVLSGVQVRPPRALLRVQTAAMKLIPESKYDGVRKQTVLQAVRELSRLDLQPELTKVRSRTLVVVGARDRLNLRAAQTAAAGIPGAQLRVVPEAGHLWNEEQPALFNDTLTNWL